MILAGGHESKHLEFYRAAQTFAERAGREFAEFPGAHGGFMTHPGAFAGRLTEILAAAQPSEGSPDARSLAGPAGAGDLWPWAG